VRAIATAPKVALVDDRAMENQRSVKKVGEDAPLDGLCWMRTVAGNGQWVHGSLPL
jgi:hypothetical protein